MDVTYKIKSVALKILNEMYLGCDEALTFDTLNLEELFGQDIPVLDIAKGKKYLEKKGYYKPSSQILSPTIADGEITAEGIDWVEECNGVKISMI